MDYTSYEESLAAINGLPVDLESKPATDFATYIQTLLENPAPRGFMLSGRAPATAEEELELKKAEEVIKKLVPASMFAGEGDSGDGFASANNGTGFSMGIGKATDAITSDAIQSAVKGFMNGGLLGAITNGLFSYGSGMLGLQSQVNDTPDPLGTLAVLQGWAPVPVTNLNTYSSEAIAQANNNEANQMSVDPGVEAAVAANDAAANAAAAQALADQGIGIDAFGGSSNSSSGGGGDLGTGTSDAAGFGGYGGVW
jgi:hypothetical protein